MTAEAGADAVVIGAGVIGLAVARALARSGREVIVLERESAIGTHTSARNSEVIHAGIYYSPGSLKARLCVSGRRALYAYAEENGIAHRQLGKLIVATAPEEVAALEGYRVRAAANGVEALDWLSPGDARAREPAVTCVAALFSPATGIIDAHGLLLCLRRDAEAAGASILTRAPVRAARVGGGALAVTVAGPSPSTVRCRLLVNAAGPWAPAVARAMIGFPTAAVPTGFFARGHYFTLAGPSPFRHLVYPVATGGGLGIHVTLDLAGTARFGPDVDWIDDVDYRFDESRAASFEVAIRRYWPGLPAGALRPGYVGVRPRLGPPGTSHDFVIQGPAQHGVPGLVNLFGIESPGLTASLALASEVAAIAAQAG